MIIFILKYLLFDLLWIIFKYILEIPLFNFCVLVHLINSEVSCQRENLTWISFVLRMVDELCRCCHFYIELIQLLINCKGIFIIFLIKNSFFNKLLILIFNYFLSFIPLYFFCCFSFYGFLLINRLKFQNWFTLVHQLTTLNMLLKVFFEQIFHFLTIKFYFLKLKYK